MESPYLEYKLQLICYPQKVMNNPEAFKKLPFAKNQKWAPKVKNGFTPESDNVYDYLSAERFF